MPYTIGHICYRYDIDYNWDTDAKVSKLWQNHFSVEDESYNEEGFFHYHEFYEGYKVFGYYYPKYDFDECEIVRLDHFSKIIIPDEHKLFVVDSYNRLPDELKQTIKVKEPFGMIACGTS